MTTTDELILDWQDKFFSEIKQWQHYDSDRLLQATDGGRTLYAWEAFHSDGSIVRQYDEITFFRALSDSSFAPPIDRIISISKIYPEKLKEFFLWPTAFALNNSPKLSKVPIRLVINPAKGEKLICQWCTDINITTGGELRRQVVGIEKDGHKVMFVISPSGVMTMATNDDISFEGE